MVVSSSVIRAGPARLLPLPRLSRATMPALVIRPSSGSKTSRLASALISEVAPGAAPGTAPGAESGAAVPAFTAQLVTSTSTPSTMRPKRAR